MKGLEKLQWRFERSSLKRMLFYFNLHLGDKHNWPAAAEKLDISGLRSEWTGKQSENSPGIAETSTV